MCIRDRMDSFVVKPQVKSVADLRGKIIGVDAPGASTYVLTTLILRKYQVDPDKDAKVLSVGDEDVRLQQLKQGLIDGAMLGPQGVVLARRAGLKTLLDVADEIDLPFVGMATANTMIERQRGELKKFLTATVRAVRYSNEARKIGSSCNEKRIASSAAAVFPCACHVQKGTMRWSPSCHGNFSPLIIVV